MNAQEFTYWLNGFFELSGSTTLTEEQVKIVKDHLKLVFAKVTPDYPNLTFPQGPLPNPPPLYPPFPGFTSAIVGPGSPPRKARECSSGMGTIPSRDGIGGLVATGSDIEFC